MTLKLTLALSSALIFSACTDPMNQVRPSYQPSTPNTTTSQTVEVETQVQIETPQPSHQAASPEKLEAYRNTMRSVAAGIKDDPQYQRLTLDTPEKKAWFKDLTYRFWDRQISSEQFLAEGLKRYPDRSYEFQFVIRGFQQHS